jgi:transcriptional regulator with XRE-family HTH domain
MNPGYRLRAIREQLGLTLREVESASARLAAKHHNSEYILTLSRLSEMETKDLIPSIYKLYALGIIYRVEWSELLAWYGIDLNETASDIKMFSVPRTHTTDAMRNVRELKMPVRLDPSFDLRKTANLGRMIERWGTVPVAYLEQFDNPDYSYAYLGSEDFTMYPILLPGSFLQVDESRHDVAAGPWRSEYERPIYFVEMRNEFTCCWCVIDDERIILQPHPLSPVRTRILRFPQEAEVLGQVVGVAMRLDDYQLPDGSAEGPSPRELQN